MEEKIFPATNQSDAKTGKAIQQISENLNVVISEGERLTNLINEVNADDALGAAIEIKRYSRFK